MWWLDENRSRLYKRFGISSDRLDKLHQFADEYLTRAETALFQNDYQQALKLARAAWGYESRAYPDVKRTGNDVVNGIMFYLALLMPFSYFMERLIFGFPNINKQILATFGIFLLVFYFLSQVHPAFQITTTPIIILIAFVVLALTVIVISIIVRKFEEQLEKIRQQGNKVYKADVGRLSASAAAFSLGISNMRKRQRSDCPYVCNVGYPNVHCHFVYISADIYASQPNQFATGDTALHWLTHPRPVLATT